MYTYLVQNNNLFMMNFARTQSALASMESLQNAAQRTVYLMTYSRADMVKFPSQESSSLAVVEAWNSCGIGVVQWVVCSEAHSNDCESINEINLYHFHMALKLAKRA